MRIHLQRPKHILFYETPMQEAPSRRRIITLGRYLADRNFLLSNLQLQFDQTIYLLVRN